MGCDIHFHSEVKIGGKWHHHCEAKISRNYALFAKMAGVRGKEFNDPPIVPISFPKGLPEDATELTKLHSEKYGVDGHSHSWLSSTEIVELNNFIMSTKNPVGWFGYDPYLWRHQNMPYFMGNHMYGFLEYPEYWAPYGVEDVRFVFFFDN